METKKMTIHRALAELKLIDSRIEKAISLVEPTGLMQANKPVNGFYPKDDFEKDVKAKYQSVTDLIERKNSIKSAIVKANGNTEVIIGGKTMTIADAINFKNVIAVKKNLIATLKRKHTAVKAKFNQENEKINTVALENAKIMIGKQGDDRVKPNDEEMDGFGWGQATGGGDEQDYWLTIDVEKTGNIVLNQWCGHKDEGGYVVFCDYIPINLLQKLISWHFWIYNQSYFEKGIILDINELNK